jgi:hypothetical protein
MVNAEWQDVAPAGSLNGERSGAMAEEDPARGTRAE